MELVIVIELVNDLLLIYWLVTFPGTLFQEPFREPFPCWQHAGDSFRETFPAGDPPACRHQNIWD